VEDDHRPVELVELLDELPQEPDVVIHLRAYPCQACDLLDGILSRYDGARPAALAPIERDGNVQGDAVHPGGEAVTLVVAGKRPPELDNYLLGQVFAIGRIPTIGGGDLVDDLPVLFKKTDEPVRRGYFRQGLLPTVDGADQCCHYPVIRTRELKNHTCAARS
jgi:hypothetical protein